ncbi:hypothetical protein LA345_37045 (plasmid) [Burkholderia vietnamiensis]|uniref:Uncharacterized protein n=1 Tax=Burkholderia vietnamiensis (strain G4 / LMG 22486) TaxID=269482 RepID=A4JVD1_BURVG|nr:hypothetical protein Bcep1808_7357 [Burkholderia vietnamiensis G4]MCB4349422.1 hypothetical protein [Burkholderia vietnamiensis]
MNVTDAAGFLAEYGARFANEEVRAWSWSDGDDECGKRASWPVGQGATVEAIASVDLSENQLQLTITERDVATSSEGGDTQIVFDLLLDFEEQALTVDGEVLMCSHEAVLEAIEQFNRRA